MRLLADIGGTNARFAVGTDEGAIRVFAHFPVADHGTFPAALDSALKNLPDARQVTEAAVAAAGLVERGEIRLTNADWVVGAKEIANRLPGARVGLFNDLEAVALALPHLEARDLLTIGAVAPLYAKGRRLAVNVGTGFGAAGAIPLGGENWIACPSEAGHIVLGATSDEEARVLDRVASRPQTVESVLSGRGLVALYRALARDADPSVQCEDILARTQSDTAAAEAANQFTLWLGRVAGDLTLATSSWGGVFLCGGVISSWRNIVDAKAFRSAFEGKPKMTERMARVATAAITRDDVALLGLLRAPIV